MTKATEERIAARKEIADARIDQQNFLGRIANRTGLALADGMDRAREPFDSPIFAAIGGAVYGAAKGTVYGGIALVALVAVTLPASVALGTAAALVGGVAALFGVIDSVKAVKYYEETKGQKRHMSEHIADTSGAAPFNARIPELSPAQQEESDRQYFQERREIRGRPTFASALRGEHRHHRGGHGLL